MGILTRLADLINYMLVLVGQLVHSSAVGGNFDVVGFSISVLSSRIIRETYYAS